MNRAGEGGAFTPSATHYHARRVNPALLRAGTYGEEIKLRSPLIIVLETFSFNLISIEQSHNATDTLLHFNHLALIL